MVRYEKWSEAQDKILLEAVADKTPYPFIAAALNRSKSSCIARWHRLHPLYRGKRPKASYAKPNATEMALAEANELVIETVPGSLLARVKWLERDDV